MEAAISLCKSICVVFDGSVTDLDINTESLTAARTRVYSSLSVSGPNRQRLSPSQTSAGQLRLRQAPLSLEYQITLPVLTIGLRHRNLGTLYTHVPAPILPVLRSLQNDQEARLTQLVSHLQSKTSCTDGKSRKIWSRRTPVANN